MKSWPPRAKKDRLNCSETGTADQVQQVGRYSAQWISPGSLDRAAGIQGKENRNVNRASLL